jgi:hypothetical protein
MMSVDLRRFLFALAFAAVCLALSLVLPLVR